MRRSILIVSIAVLAMSVHCDAWADAFPYCMQPFVYPVSMATSSAQVDLKRYQGTWYEVARFPAPFLKNCVCSEANYVLDSQGYIQVKNTCSQTDGTSITFPAKAYSRNPLNTKIEVYFQPQTPGNYWILDIDPEYKWAVVGEPCSKMGWVLSRVGKPSQKVIDNGVNVFRAKGYDVSGLIYRPASC